MLSGCLLLYSFWPTCPSTFPLTPHELGGMTLQIHVSIPEPVAELLFTIPEPVTALSFLHSMAMSAQGVRGAPPRRLKATIGCGCNSSCLSAVSRRDSIHGWNFHICAKSPLFLPMHANDPQHTYELTEEKRRNRKRKIRENERGEKDKGSRKERTRCVEQR